MNVMSTLGEIVRDLLIFVGAVTALLVISLVVIAKLPHANPLKHLFVTLAYRLGATAAAGLLAIPIEPIPGLDALYDLGMPVLLIWYWFTFFREAWRGAQIRTNGGWQPGRRKP